MELKDYQKTTLDIVKQYLEKITKEKQSGNTKHASLDAWAGVGRGVYFERKNGLSQDVPNFCLKIPTGGGKTLLAVKTIDLINSTYLQKQNGLVLWIVPTSQIYNQTLKNLRNREHPYRQFLDISSSGKTLILERTEKFSPSDIEENLVVMLLMLPAAARQTKETLRIFKDSGVFTDFFPLEDDVVKQTELLRLIPNLDRFGQKEGFWQEQVKTSLGNVLKLLSPIIILDEGQKAYSELAQKTIYDFNPKIIVELSATPRKESNILVNILGIELKREEMIKLDLHVINKADADWKQTLLSAHNQRIILEDKANDYRQNTNNYIRPICLIQVERTGKDQRAGGFIHSEDVREHLIKILGVPPHQIAVKTSSQDELKEVDDIGGLMSPNCHIRYIITKQALQEGWDCPFAYVLAILANPSSKTALTQLVGRVLRQPYARKTKIIELDESYVYCFRQNANKLLLDIDSGFRTEGLEDLIRNIDVSDREPSQSQVEITANIRPQFDQLVKSIVLPVFSVPNGSQWRLLNYEVDIASQINWSKINISPLFNLALSQVEDKDIEEITTLNEVTGKIENQIISRNRQGALGLDCVLFARQLTNIIPNPWLAYSFASQIISQLVETWKTDLVTSNFVYIIEETKKHLELEKNKLAKNLFLSLIKNGNIKFIAMGKNGGYTLPSKLNYQTTSKDLIRSDNKQIQNSLFDYVPEEQFNEELEKPFAQKLDIEKEILFWYRSQSKKDYHLQGWLPNKVYPDFIFSKKDNHIYVVETKGEHLAGSNDTNYKQELLSLCNQLVDDVVDNNLGLNLKKLNVHYQMIFGNEWASELTKIFSTDLSGKCDPSGSRTHGYLDESQVS